MFSILLFAIATCDLVVLGYKTAWNPVYGPPSDHHDHHPGYDYRPHFHQDYDHQYEPRPRPQQVIPSDVMVDIINGLGIKLLAIHNEGNENNIAISPYGALSMLVVLGEGLTGEAVREVQHAAHLPNDISVVRVGLRDIHRHLKSYFIPKEGFLAGLTLNHENVTLNKNYEDVLKFYGFDLESFNNALYPDPLTTEKPLEMTVTTTMVNEMMVKGEEKLTTMSTEETTTITTMMTPMETKEDKDVESTTQYITEPIVDETDETTTKIPSTTEMSITTMTMETTTMVPITTTTETMATTTLQPTTTTLQPTTTTLQPTTTTLQPTTTTEDQTTLGTTVVSDVTTLGTTTINPETTTVRLTTRSTENTSNNPTTTTTESTTTSEPTTIEPTTTEPTTTEPTTKEPTTTVPTTITSTATEITTITTTTKSKEDIEATIPTIPDTTATVTTEETTVTTDGTTVTTEGTTITTEGTTVTTEETTVTTEETTLTTLDQNFFSTQEPFIQEILPTTAPNYEYPFYGDQNDFYQEVDSRENLLVQRSDVNATNLKRNARSVVDYIIAKYYDNSYDRYDYYDQKPRPGTAYVPNSPGPSYVPNSPGTPYLPEEPLTFLTNGQFREGGVSFMVYDTVLPFLYVPHLNALALSFPLDNDKYYLLLLLPVNPQGVNDLICDLRLNGSLKYIIKNLKLTHVKATIPSFTLKGYVVLTPTLQKLGIGKVFEPRHADFSPMTAEREIYVTNIEQAVTVTIRNYVNIGNLPNYRNLYQHDPVHFKADHPFLYFVIDAELHVALMAGKIVNPLNTRVR